MATHESVGPPDRSRQGYIEVIIAACAPVPLEASWRCSVQTLCRWISVGLLVMASQFDCRAQIPAEGDIFDSGGGGTPGDVYDSGGGRGTPGDVFDVRTCVKNGTLDRCCVQRHQVPQDPLTRQYGLPVYLRSYSYAFNNNRCVQLVGDACHPAFSLCWGWKNFTTDRGNTPKINGEDPKTDNPNDPNKRFSSKARTDKVCDLQRLAGLIMMRYGTGRPIATVKVVNSQRPTYLVLLPGVEQEKPGQATMAGDALIGYYNVAALDAYRLAIMDAVSKLPRGATLILAGHSLGGIEAQNVVQSLAQRYGFKVAQVVSFGAPVMDGGQPGTNYLNVRSLGDPLQALDRRFLLPGDPNLLISKNGIGNPLGPNGSHNNYDKNSSGLSQHPVPRVSTLTTQCYEIDLTTLQQFAAPDLFSRVTGAGQCPPNAAGPSGPSGPAKCSWQPKAPLPAQSAGRDPLDRGLLLPDENYMKKLAASKCLVILVRNSSPPALRWIGQSGYKPKPMAIKGKTLRDKDFPDGYPEEQKKKYLGLASAKGMEPADRRKLTDAGYIIQSGFPELILDQDGSKFYSDTDLHGVYNTNGTNAWSDQLGQQLKCNTLDQGIQHPPHDDWPDRNNKAIAGDNAGPQIGGGQSITAILPDGRTLQINTLAEMKQLYKAIGVNFNSVYPNY
jgi:hypothetical protein